MALDETDDKIRDKAEDYMQSDEIDRDTLDTNLDNSDEDTGT